MGGADKKAAGVSSLTTVVLGAALGLLVVALRRSTASSQSVNLMGWTSDLLGLGASRVEAMQNCTDFACLRTAHERPGKFNFPHFFIIGYPLAGAMPLHGYLTQHPQGLNPRLKEPKFFTSSGNCWHPESAGGAWGCGAAETEYYLNHTLRMGDALASGLEKAAFESTTDYVWGGGAMSAAVYELAAGVRTEVPWVKIILGLREPISHQIAAKAYIVEMLKNPAGGFNPANAEPCIKQLLEGQVTMFDCIKMPLKKEGAYLEPLNAWLTAFPPEQVHVLQYENLTGEATRSATLEGVMQFLGMDPALGPTDLPHSEGAAQGWPMQKSQLEELVAAAQTKAERIADVLERYGLHASADWMAGWRAVWDASLASCDENDTCTVMVQ